MGRKQLGRFSSKDKIFGKCVGCKYSNRGFCGLFKTWGHLVPSSFCSGNYDEERKQVIIDESENS